MIKKCRPDQIKLYNNKLLDDMTCTKVKQCMHYERALLSVPLKKKKTFKSINVYIVYLQTPWSCTRCYYIPFSSWNI